VFSAGEEGENGEDGEAGSGEEDWSVEERL
jgi:hypothetical protein